MKKSISTDKNTQDSLAKEGDFISRWSRRKNESRQQKEHTNNEIEVVPKEVIVEPVLTDKDMPPIESLTEESDYSGFLSPKVSEALRKQALKKLFHSTGFNVCDGLDDYDEDFTTFAKLGDIITADMKHQLEIEAQRIQALVENESNMTTGNDRVVAEENPAESTKLAVNNERQPVNVHHQTDEIVDDLEVKPI